MDDAENIQSDTHCVTLVTTLRISISFLGNIPKPFYIIILCFRESQRVDFRAIVLVVTCFCRGKLIVLLLDRTIECCFFGVTAADSGNIG